MIKITNMMTTIRGVAEKYQLNYAKYDITHIDELIRDTVLVGTFPHSVSLSITYGSNKKMGNSVCLGNKSMFCNRCWMWSDLYCKEILVG